MMSCWPGVESLNTRWGFHTKYVPVKLFFNINTENLDSRKIFLCSVSCKL